MLCVCGCVCVCLSFCLDPLLPDSPPQDPLHPDGPSLRWTTLSRTPSSRPLSPDPLRGTPLAGPSSPGPPSAGEGTDFGQSRFGHPDLTNLGQSNFGSGVCHGGAQRVGPKPRKNRAPKGGTGPKISLFSFPSPAPIFALFVSLWVSSRGIFLVFLKRRSPEMCTFGVQVVV